MLLMTELCFASPDLRFPLDGAVELHFSATPEIRLPSPAPTPAVPVDTTDDPVTRWDSYENIVAMGSPLDGDTDIEDINGESLLWTISETFTSNLHSLIV
jgi:tensin